MLADAVIIAAIGVFALGWIVAQYAKRIHAAGSLYDYVSNGLGRTLGAAAGWLYYGGTIILTTGLGVLLGGYVHDNLLPVLEVDLDRARAGRRRVLLSVPAPREDHPVRRRDLEVLAPGNVLVDVDDQGTAGPGVEGGRLAHPARHQRRVGEKRENRLGTGVDPDLADDYVSFGLRHGASSFRSFRLPS